MQTPTPQQLMQQFAQKVARTRAYRYTWEFQERDEQTGKLGAKQIYMLEFLQPHYRKMTIVQRDAFSNGAVLIHNPDLDTKVHARKGFIRRVYERNDPEVARFFETDLGYILKDLQAAVSRREGGACQKRAAGATQRLPTRLRATQRPRAARRACVGAHGSNASAHRVRRFQRHTLAARLHRLRLPEPDEG